MNFEAKRLLQIDVLPEAKEKLKEAHEILKEIYRYANDEEECDTILCNNKIKYDSDDFGTAMNLLQALADFEEYYWR